MEMQEPGFWDDPEKSNQKMREAKGLKDIVNTMDGLSGQYEDILTLIEMGSRDHTGYRRRVERVQRNLREYPYQYASVRRV